MVNLGNELTNLCTTAGIKGRKADKVAENFMWNMSVLKTEMDLLRALKDDCECALKQVSFNHENCFKGYKWDCENQTHVTVVFPVTLSK